MLCGPEEQQKRVHSPLQQERWKEQGKEEQKRQGYQQLQEEGNQAL